MASSRMVRPCVLDPADRTDLVRLARVSYPHPGLGDAPYVRAVDRICAEAAELPSVLRTVLNCLALVRAAPTSRADGDVDGELTDHLRRVDDESPFFREFRFRVSWHLYDDREVWDFIGYPGASFAMGGYLTRGFNDLDWLPEPRISRVSAERGTEV